MKYKFTQKIIDLISPYVDINKVTVNENTLTAVVADNKNKTEEYSDTITICHNFLIEIFDNAVNVFYIEDHQHFFSETDDDWQESAKEFIIKLLTTPIFVIEKLRGNDVSSSTYYFLKENDKTEFISHELICHTTHHIIKKLFARKSKQFKTWYWNKDNNCFDCRPPYEPSNPPYKPSEDVFKAIQASDDYAIEISLKGNGFTYRIIKLDFDEYEGSRYYFWTPISHPISIYDTVEKAEENAREYIKGIR